MVPADPITALILSSEVPSWADMAEVLALVERDSYAAERASRWALSVLRAEGDLDPAHYASLVSLLRPEAWAAIWVAGGLDLRVVARRSLTLG